MTWSLFNHNYNQDPGDCTYLCDGLYQAGVVNCDAWWPMTDPMVGDGVDTRWYHAGEPLGPYADGTGPDEYGAYWTWSAAIGPISTGRKRVVAHDAFNSCLGGDTDYVTNFEQFANYFGVPQIRLAHEGTLISPIAPESYEITTHNVWLGNSDGIVAEFFGKINFYREDGYLLQATNIDPRIYISVSATNVHFNVAGHLGGGTTAQNQTHSFDMTQPYLITATCVSSIASVEGGFVITVGFQAQVSQPGNGTHSFNHSGFQQFGPTVEGLVDYHLNPTPTGGTVTIGRSGNNTHWVGMGYGGGQDAHAALLTGLARNYEDYTCP